MAPAFSSLRQALAFLLLLSGLLVLPALASRWNLLSRPDAYATMPESTGPFSFHRQQIFEETSDLDIVFLGASVIYFQIDTPYVQQALSARLGREARVISLASLWTGEDKNYLMVQDLLERRKVKMLVLCMYQEFPVGLPEPYAWAHRFYQSGAGGKGLEGLPFRWQAAFYGEAILGTPRHLYSRLVPPLKDTAPEAQALGAKLRPVSYGGDESTYKAFTPAPLDLPPQAMIYSPETKPHFHFAGEEMSTVQKHFAGQIGRLLQEHGVKLVILDIPPKYRNATIKETGMAPGYWPSGVEPEVRYDTVRQACYWPDIFGVSLDMVGLPQTILFKGLSEEQVKLLYSDRMHFNTNGGAFFTRTITPALLELYERQQPSR